MNVPNYPSEEVKEFGERVARAMMDASIQHSTGGCGGCKHYDLTNFDEELRPYVEAYLKGNRDSAALIYAAMRTKELE